MRDAPPSDQLPGDAQPGDAQPGDALPGDQLFFKTMVSIMSATFSQASVTRSMR